MTHKHKAKKSKSPSVAVGIGIGFLFAIALVAIVNYDRWGKSQPSPPIPASRTATTATRTVSPAVYRIAAQFVCTCGSCGEKPLETCDCPTAVEERGFIQQQLASGRTEAAAAGALQAKYGGRKEAGAGTLTLTDAQIIDQLNQGTLAAGHVATTADRLHIISHFKCPCEQCAIDELRDCECPHPKGAQEVKKFIDTTIAKQEHTVGEIVTLVEQRYGGRIR